MLGILIFRYLPACAADGLESGIWSAKTGCMLVKYINPALINPHYPTNPRSGGILTMYPANMITTAESE